MKTTRLVCKLVNQTVAVAMAAVITISPVAPVFAADHRDSPAINGDGRADLLDVYAFVNPNDTNKVVLALTVNPLTIGGAAQIAFADDVLYQFKIDNDGDFKEDLVIQAIFTPAVPGPQQFTVIGPAKPKKTGAMNAVLKVGETITGPADGTITTQGDVKVFAGLRDEPFFFDQIFIFRALGILPGGPITNRAAGINFYAGLNVSALCVEVPASLLRGAEGNQTIRIWSTTSRSVVTKRSTTKPNKDTPSYVQIDRTALPTLNTVLIPKPMKDAFNQATPDRDIALFANIASNSLFTINGDAVYSDTVAHTVLPDVLTLNLASTDGFLNGRRPQDDVIDAVLDLASEGAVTSDAVPTNDKPFLPDFPFLAAPHDPSEVIPGRN